MDFTSEVFSLSRLRELDLAYLLEMLGHEVVSRKKGDTDYWYVSPLRNERTASFHVDRVANEWYDFGLMAGGNPVDFLLRYHGCSITELLDRMNASFSPHQLDLHKPDLHGGRAGSDSKLTVKDVRPLYAYPLKNYLHERSIPIAVADSFARRFPTKLMVILTKVSAFRTMRAAERSATKISSKAVRPKALPTWVRALFLHIFSRALWTSFLTRLCTLMKTRARLIL